MGRRNSEAAIAGPSIALLQERFRQLQRVREKREERQLLDLFYSDHTIRIDASKSGNLLRQRSNNKPVDPEIYYFSNEMNTLQDPLSLRLELNTKYSNYRDIRIQPGGVLQSFSDTGRGGTIKTPNKLDISDVDTSLHL